MNKILLSQIHHFKRVTIPRYFESKIQAIALKHLNLTDMGKLRDRTEGQSYFNKLKTDIFAEYAFENIIGMHKFNWEARDAKNFKRKKYIFQEKQLQLITFENDSLPKIDSLNLCNSIFINVNTDNRVLVSKLATLKELEKIATIQESRVLEISEFKNLKDFSTLNEMISLLD